ncbi:acyltransferase family protein [Nocardioides acrostichi]|uniref:Acyltransferase n=1 Tax=Nocardioides acrostichi TaxID=2784339 RepID=A0A930UZH3_9ACTN|nr:acyltransferase [Nocardioides acrostichi]MBF4161101.1 acyltransferase [Nocardioides acrostichi]
MSARTGRIDGLDLLRGVAVGLVVLRHAVPGPFPGAGVVGVVMFFALSGWLITGLLADELARTGHLDLRAFYRRRVRRLVPPLLVMLAGYTLVTLTLDPLGERGDLLRTLAVALTWIGDLPVLHADGATFHLWTLALEEQFYLLWPGLLLLAHRRARRGLGVAGAALVCLTGLLATAAWLWPDPDLAYALPTSWAGCFVVGGGARLYARRLPRMPRWTAPVALAVLGVLCVVPWRGHTSAHWLTYLVGGPVIAALTVVLVLAWRDRVRVTGPARVLVSLGVVSYAVYLWDYPLALWLRPHGAWAAGAAVPLALAAAWLTRRFVELPLARRRQATPRVVVRDAA